MTDDAQPQRIAKVMARAGLCSRREAERWIEEGRVTLNGEILNTPAVKVGNDDHIEIDGKPLPRAPKTQIWGYYKPTGLITSHNDEQGRKTVFDAVAKRLPHVISVGRLDLNSEGLLLLTNNGEYARYLEHPDQGLKRIYRVRVFGDIEVEALNTLKQGVTIDGVHYAPIKIDLEQSLPQVQSKQNNWLNVTLQEGKNREIRKVMAYLNLKVNRLIRLQYGDFELGNLRNDQIKEFPEKLIPQRFKSNNTGT